MPSFTVTVRVKLPRAADDQVQRLLGTVPHALFDPIRRELVQISVVGSEGADSARDKAVRHVTWALDDGGLRHHDYEIESLVSPVDE
jgi:hypothetical protein